MNRPDGERLARARAAILAAYGDGGDTLPARATPAAAPPAPASGEDMQLILSRVRGLVAGAPPAARAAGGWWRRSLRRVLGRVMRFETFWQQRSNEAVLAALEELSGAILAQDQRQELARGEAAQAARHRQTLQEEVASVIDSLAAGSRRTITLQEDLQKLASRLEEEVRRGAARGEASEKHWAEVRALSREGVRLGQEVEKQLLAAVRRLAQVEEHQRLEAAEMDTLGFMERFRGSEEEIQRRLEPYLKLFSRLQAPLPGPVLDVGCGRGELLELCRRHDIPAQGLEHDAGLVGLLRSRGLDVEENDALTGLRGRPTASLGAVFSAQVIEHLPAGAMLQLIAEAHRVLAPGGLLVMETLNPSCLAMLANTFYRDPGHRQPLHPETAGFILESAGFHDVQVVTQTPVPQEHALMDVAGEGDEELRAGINRNVRILNHLLFGPQEYHVIGVRR